MKHQILTLASLFLLLSVNAFALQNDLQQEVIISAKNQQADIKNNQMIFNGPVKVTQGSITITAETLRAFSKAGGDHKILIAIGNPATYSQTMDNGLLASASAKEIRYDLSTRVLQLSGDAVLEQSGSKVKSSSITYNMLEQKLTAQSGGKGSDRVTTIIKAENYQDSQSKKTSIKTKNNTDKSVQQRPSTSPSGHANTQTPSEPQALSKRRSQSQSKKNSIQEETAKNAEIKSTKNAPITSLNTVPIIAAEETQTKIIGITPTNKNNWYIQVGVFAQSHSQDNLIKKINKSGFSYRTYPIHLKGRDMSRLLIGPYKNLPAAKKEINRVKLEIEKSAYFYQLK